jgi:hypothetical protein
LFIDLPISAATRLVTVCAELESKPATVECIREHLRLHVPTPDTPFLAISHLNNPVFKGMKEDSQVATLKLYYAGKGFAEAIGLVNHRFEVCRRLAVFPSLLINFLLNFRS